MASRHIFICLLLTGCATVVPQPVLPPKPVVVPNVPPQVGTKPSEPKKIETPATQQVIPVRQYAHFEEWKQDFISRTIMAGYNEAFVRNVFQSAILLDNVLSLDTAQPEFSKPISSYVKGAVSARRAQAASLRLGQDPHLPKIEQELGVPTEILGAIWVMESDMGRVQGSTDVISALSTLAFQGRRRVWAESQLISCLKILSQGMAPREKLIGSWAGAMGQTQFLPENYLKIARDGDGDGVADIWGSSTDALASAGNLLKTYNWVEGQSWAVEVSLPVGFDYYLAETTKKTPEAWGALGVVRADGRAWSEVDQMAEATILLPSGAQGPAFMAFPNHFVIRRYNNSIAYALAVGLLADGISGQGDLKTPWPEEIPLSKSQRFGTQNGLKKLGYYQGAIDGVIGIGTRAALREWQKANSRIADGYLNASLADELTTIATAP